jgi:hypothetical protein
MLYFSSNRSILILHSLEEVVMRSRLLLLIVFCVAVAPVFAEAETWSKDVMPIIQERCLECHRPGQVAPFSLMTYQEARPWAKAIKQQVGTGKMPPYLAHPSSLPMMGDMNLSQKEIDTIVAWVDQGAKQGNKKDLPPAKEFKTFEGGWKLGDPDVVLQPEVPFTVSGDITDLYQCFQIPLGVDQDVWLKGVEFQAGNPAVAHHFILFEDTNNKFPELDAAYPGPGCECADMNEVGSTKVIKMWAPGNTAPLAPEGIGNKILAGKNLILQAHYYNNTGEDQVDQSRVALHVAKPEETMDKMFRLQMVVQPRLDIKAGDPNSRHEAVQTAFKDMTYYSAGVHMHLRGKSMGQYALLPGAEEEITMLWVPEYDFNWQLNYDFAEPFKAPKGTKFIMRSVHDNSAENPNNPDPTADVKWGSYSGDEMAFSGGYFVYDDEQLGITPEVVDFSKVSSKARVDSD